MLERDLTEVVKRGEAVLARWPDIDMRSVGIAVFEQRKPVEHRRGGEARHKAEVEEAKKKAAEDARIQAEIDAKRKEDERVAAEAVTRAELKQRQRENGLLSGAAIEQRFIEDQLVQLKAELEREQVRNKQLVGRIATIGANAGRLGIDPEELYRAVLKPVRSMSRAGSNLNGARKRFRRS